jgi:CYTH domain-containing protein
MPQEIERKFLIQSDDWRSLATPKLYRQGYIDTEANKQVSIHRQADDYYLLIQTPQVQTRLELPRQFGPELMALSRVIAPNQGQLRSADGLTLRPRIAGQTGLFTIKTRSTGISRSEYEFEIPLAQANQLLDQVCDRPLIEKYRSKIKIDHLTWEVDEFLGENVGLILAEVELDSESQTFDIPTWIGEEVSGMAQYFNSYLAQHPFTTWT